MLRSPAADFVAARDAEETCLECGGERVDCPLRLRPYVLCEETWRGETIYTVRAGCCPAGKTKNIGVQVNFEALLKASGLTAKQRKQTFDAYAVRGLGAEVADAKGRAMLAAAEGLSLVLAGKQGTGKSHLAVAVMLEVMKKGVPALFRYVPAMLDELREGNLDHTYYAKMKQLKEIPCLVLDDLGKERNTDAGLEYLSQIMDHRYRYCEEGLQTIITTNAEDQIMLAEWSSESYIVPILSRMNEMGAWVKITQAVDYRGNISRIKSGKGAA